MGGTRDTEHIYDAIVVGGGPAGYSAAIYAARASLDTLVVEQGMAGGQIATSDVIENYPGIPSIGGAELGQRMLDHAEACGARSAYGMVERLARMDDGTFFLQTDSGSYASRAVVMATGAKPRMAGFSGEQRFRGRGVSYCATCDAMFYRGKKVFVVGGGASAVEEARFLANVASDVVMVVRRDRFRAPRGMVDKLLTNDKITVRYQTSIVGLEGETLPERISFRDNATGSISIEEFEPGSFGIFVFAGNDPVVDLVKPFVDLSEDGGVLTDDRMATRTPGLFCAGDMRSKALRQVVTAASDGAIAGDAAYRYVEDRFRA